MRARRLRHTRNTRGKPVGSALILMVVLTSLLAILAVLFIMTARIDKMASSAASENSQLGLAVETVVSQISEVLANDVPGMPASRSYYDYPDVNNPWLADLEPYQSGTNYYWRQITNLTGPDPNCRNAVIKVIGERDSVNFVNSPETTADADGDGVGDARWYFLPGVVSSRGKRVQAAVRIIDNGAMLNVNTAWTLLPNEPDSLIDGSSQLQINVAAAVGKSPADLQLERTNQADKGTPAGRAAYEQAVIWQYLPLPPNSPYTPFDISDELGLRYRFCLYHSGSDSRAEKWGNLNLPNMPSTPIDRTSDLPMWYRRVAGPKVGDPDFLKDVNDYAYRHVLTTYNMDRILTPKPVVLDSGRVLNKRVNVNVANWDEMHAAVLTALSDRNPGDPSVQILANQITANLLDYIDDDNEVTVVAGPGSTSGAMYYGFERPCVYLSELAYTFKLDKTTLSESYAIELYKPFFEDGALPSDKWRIEVRYAAGTTLTQGITWSGTRRFHVMRAQNPQAPLPIQFQDPCEPAAAAQIGFVRNNNPTEQTLTVTLQGATMVSLQRLVGGNWLTVDYKAVPTGFASPTADANSPTTANSATHCLQRDISDNKCILRLWSDPNVPAPNLGSATGNYASKNPTVIQAYPTNRPLTNIGELGMVFAVSAYSGVSEVSTPESVLINLCDPRFAELFNYLTVMDPTRHGAPADETRIMGRININTAPRSVLAQLPWIQYPSGNLTRAQGIVNRRDAAGAYKSIGDLMQVPELRDLGSDKLDNLSTDVPKGPDLTGDTARDDLEERDILFTRLSDLVTVRSDVFTAYILVRIGQTGPQKRMVAVLDRSTVTPSNPKVRIVALYAVADSR